MTSSIVHDPARRFAVAAMAAVGLGAGYLAWLLSGSGSVHTDAVVSDGIFVVAPLVAAAAVWRAHVRHRARHSAWGWIALGCLTWAAASLVFAGYQVIGGRTAPLPSPADIGYVGYAVPMVIGLLRFPGVEGNGWSRWRSVLDGLVVAFCLLLSSALLVLDPVIESTTAEPWTRIVALCYPLADVTVASLVLARCLLLPDTRRRIWVQLSLGLLVLSVTDSIYVSETSRGQFTPGTPLDLGWYVAFALIGLSALVPVDPAERSTSETGPGFVRQLIPSAAIGLAFVTCLLDPGSLAGGHWWFLGIALVFVVARKLVVAADQVVEARDLTDAVDRRTAQLRHREQWWQDVVSNLTDVVIVVDHEGRLVYCSPSVNSVLGHWPQLETAAELNSQVHPEDSPKVQAAIRPVLDGTRRHGFAECRVKRADGGYAWFEVQAVAQMARAALEGAVLTLHDISERRELTDRLMHQAHHDSLTGLPNRTLLMERIVEALSRPGERSFGLLLLDLDDFKVINDRHGHASGDVVLDVIGERLMAAVRRGDTVARLGGDEFALLVHGSTEEIRVVAERMAKQIAEPVVVGGRSFLVRASIGIVLADDSSTESAASLLSHADIALYEAKARDKGGVVMIAGPERDDAAQQVHLREQISQPDLAQFHVVYQPIIDLVSGQMRGVEALLRWNHPDLGPVPPDVFIPMAEHGGSISVLGWHVLDEACAQLARWHADHPERRLAMGINASVRQLDEPGFARRLLEVVDSHGLARDQVVLELTEQSLAIDFETAVEVVAELRAGGVSVAVDDYGTGYSSLRYLDRFDADVVKIDRSFVWNVVESVHTQKIVRSVMHMAESLDLQSIAEGIETHEQLEVVRALGCELGQGYLFSRPVPADEISAMLADPAATWPVAPGDHTDVLASA